MFTAAVASSAAAAAAFDGLSPNAERDHRADCDNRQQDPVQRIHPISPANAYAANDTIHATLHCIRTTPAVFKTEPSSRRIVATAATHGVYSSVKTKKLTAERVENSVATEALPKRTSNVLTTDSLATNPEISAVAQRQSAKPSGVKIGAITRPTKASRLLELSVTTFRRVSKLWRN